MIRKDKRKVIENILYEYLDARSTSESLELLEKKTEEISTRSFVEKFPEELKILSEFIFIGLGREKSLRAEGSLKNKDYLEIRESMSIKEDELRRRNEAELTQIKIQSNKRKKRKAELKSKDLSWDLILGEYKTGSTMSELSSKYNISMHLMREQLKDDGDLDLSRSTLEKRKIANSELSKLEDKFIIELLNENNLDSKDVLWKKAKVIYPWLLRRQFYAKIEELGLSRSEEEIKEIKRIKSKTERNLAYSVMRNTINAVIAEFGSVDNLVEKYMNSSLGSYSKIAATINKNQNLETKVSVRQIEKVITRNENYIPKKSAPQLQLLKFVRETFPKFNIKEEFTLKGTKKRIDIFIEELNVGIEFNGDYWHSQDIVFENYGMTSYFYHSERVRIAKERNISLVYVWEKDWQENYEEVENAIKREEWSSNVLNKYTNESYYTSNSIKSKTMSKVVDLLEESKINYKREPKSEILEIGDTSINFPKITSFSDKKKALNMQKEFESKGKELVTVLPWSSPEMIFNFISHKAKVSTPKQIPARKCSLKITKGINKLQKDFISKNHLLGYTRNLKNITHTVTLEHEGEQVMMAVFSKTNKENIMELKRLVSLSGVSVQGGASKILKNYIKGNPSIEKITTFSDCDLGWGSVYSKLGFKLIQRSKEQLTWYNPMLKRKFSNVSLMMVGADRLLKNLENYEAVGVGGNLPSNAEIVQQYGFVPVYDSGYKKWELEVNNTIH